MQQRILLLVIMGLGLVHSVFAACSGSGAAWSCTAGSSPSDVQTAINSASDGAVITFASGSYSWGGSRISPMLSKGVTLLCPNTGSCVVTANNVVFDLPVGTSSKLYRISGFVFNQNGGSILWTCPSGGCGPTLISNFRFDHNSLNLAEGMTALYFGENTATDTYFYGVIDHNTVTSAGSVYFAIFLNGNSDGAVAGHAGTGNNIFFEDNTITITAMTNSGSGCIDSWGGAAIVWRRNRVTNCRVLAHGVTHAWGPVNFEIYDNVIIQNARSVLGDGYRSIHHQGSGEMTVFNNLLTSFSGHSPSAIALLHYRSFATGSGVGRCDGTVSVDGNRLPLTTYYGYPCKRQPGRDASAQLHPVYVWNNRWSDTGEKIDLACEGQSDTNPDTCSHHVVVNRDYYNARGSVQTSPTTPFNGASGMGFGTLANRPASCVTNSNEAGGGVGYWATDQGEWDSTNGATPDGQLYRCSATNAWTLHYKPYTYPHPLTGGAPPPMDTTPPSQVIGISATLLSSQVNLAWAASTDNVGVVRYNVHRATTTEFTPAVSNRVGQPTTIDYVDTPSGSGTYYYKITAEDMAGNIGAESAQVSVILPAANTTPQDTTPPSAPNNPTGTAQSSTRIDLIWAASTDNVGVVGYQVERCLGSACGIFTQIGIPVGVTYSDTGLTPNTTYRYRVRAIDAAGNPSAYSAIVSVRSMVSSDATPPTAPTNLVATIASNTQINLAWAASTDNVGVVDYQVEQCSTVGCSNFAHVATPTGTMYASTGLVAGTSYSYRVRALDVAGNPSLYSTIATASTSVNKFDIGDRIILVLDSLVVATPSGTAVRLGTHINGEFGTIIGGPVSADGLIFWQINYDTNPDGWSGSEDRFEKFVTRTPGDLNDDRTVNILDVNLVIADLGRTSGFNPVVDTAPPLGQINIFDVMTVIMNFGKNY